MPYWDAIKRVKCKTDELCIGCRDASVCNVIQDIDINEQESIYNEKFISACPSFVPLKGKLELLEDWTKEFTSLNVMDGKE